MPSSSNPSPFSPGVKKKMFNLKIQTRNQAFDGDKRTEVIRILKDAIQKLEEGKSAVTLFDTNGNSVGFFTLTNR